MKRMTRRDILLGASATVVVQLLPACGSSSDRAGGSNQLSNGVDAAASFLHGVASGDPMPDRVILWTRATPDEGGFSQNLNVTWEIASDENFSDTLFHGVVVTGPSRDYTVKLDVVGLSPAQTYYYRFSTSSAQSQVGRTKTAPQSGVDKLRFVVASCANYGIGYFHAYRRIAEQQNIDAVLHLGDYIYEYGPGGFEGDGLCLYRGCEPEHEIVTLDDYRMRHAHYKTDPDLQEAHRLHPWVVTWDDHEFTNNAWREGAENHSEDEGDYLERKAIAAKVYDEWMPIRLPDRDKPIKIFRKLAYGNLVDLFMLDTRSYGRDEQVGTLVPLTGSGATDIEALDDPNRSILGTEQLAWLESELKNSQAQWKVLGQQVIFSPLQILGQPAIIGSGTIINADSWDGYRASRARIMDLIEEEQLDDVVILTGDVHSSWAIDVPRDPYDPLSYNPLTGDGSKAIELVTPGITMPALPGQESAPATNPHVHYVNTTFNGYMLVELTAEQTRAEWWHVSDVRLPEGTEVLGREISAQSGNNRLDRLPVVARSPTFYGPKKRERQLTSS